MISKEDRSVVSRNMLAIELEPTPYKTDLWNSFIDLHDGELLVLYTEIKNPAADGGQSNIKNGHIENILILSFLVLEL